MTDILRRVDQRFANDLRMFNSILKLFLRRLNPKVKYTDISLVSIDPDNRNEIELFCCLKNLPYCGSRDKPLEEILALKEVKLNHCVFMSARILLDIEQPRLSMKHYNTEVRYCKIIKPSTPDELEGLLGFHYDFDEHGQTNHPIFHAQQNNKCGDRIFSDPNYAKVISNHTCVPILEGPPQLKYIRIPTPQMDIFSTVINVIADYIVHPNAQQHKDLFRNFLRDVHRHFIPFNLNNLNYVNSDFKVNKNCLSYWYPNF